MAQNQFVQTFIESPTDSITQALMGTVESFGMLKGSILGYNHHQLISEITTIQSLYYDEALKAMTALAWKYCWH